MAKKYKVTLDSTYPTFKVSFKNSSGKRVRRSTKTKDESEAKRIQHDLEDLFNKRIKKPDDTKIPRGLHGTAKELYFQDSFPNYSSVPKRAKNFRLLGAETKLIYEASEEAKWERRDLEKFLPEGTSFNDLLRSFVHYEEMKKENERLQGVILDNQIGIELPTTSQILTQFREYEFENGKTDAVTVCNWLERQFKGKVPENIKLITAADIEKVINTDQTVKSTQDTRKKNNRKNRLKGYISRVYTYLFKTYGYNNNVIKGIDKVRGHKASKEIIYHNFERIESILESIDDIYWKTTVATLAYAGLLPKELLGLRVEDINLSSNSISVSHWTKGKYTHGLKNEFRARTIQIIYPLKKILKSYVKAGKTGRFLFFPVTVNKKDDKLHPEQWVRNTFCNHLKGRKNTSQGSIPAILPNDVIVRDLRHTLASVMLREGYSYNEIASVYGHSSPQITRDHYARIMAEEVDLGRLK